MGIAWQTRLRKALLIPGSHKWNAWVRDITAWLEKPYWPIRGLTYCPYIDTCGPTLILGPEVFIDENRSVINWKGENYYRLHPDWVKEESLTLCDYGDSYGTCMTSSWFHNQRLSQINSRENIFSF